MKKSYVCLIPMLCAVAINAAGCGKAPECEAPSSFALVEVARSDHQWTGVAVSKTGRIFVNYPRWSPAVPFSVGELDESGEAAPYPDVEWNTWDENTSPAEHFVCVQSVYVDANDDLWILDPANAYLRGVIQGGAKLLRVDLESNEIVQTIHFDSSTAPANSYLNDVRIDTKTRTAYITDSGAGAIVVVDLESGRSRRLLAEHPSTKAEEMTLTIGGNPVPLRVHADGIALDAGGGYLYYQALTGRTLYRIATGALRNESIAKTDLAASVETVGESGASDGLLFDCGYIYLTSIERNAIRRITPEGVIESIVSNSLLEWPDSFSRAADGSIYVTTSRIAFPPAERAHRIFKLEPKS